MPDDEKKFTDASAEAFGLWVAKSGTERWTWNTPLTPLELVQISALMALARAGNGEISSSDVRFAVDALIADVLTRIQRDAAAAATLEADTEAARHRLDMDQGDTWMVSRQLASLLRRLRSRAEDADNRAAAAMKQIGDVRADARLRSVRAATYWRGRALAAEKRAEEQSALAAGISVNIPPGALGVHVYDGNLNLVGNLSVPAPPDDLGNVPTAAEAAASQADMVPFRLYDTAAAIGRIENAEHHAGCAIAEKLGDTCTCVGHRALSPEDYDFGERIPIMCDGRLVGYRTRDGNIDLRARDASERARAEAEQQRLASVVSGAAA